MGGYENESLCRPQHLLVQRWSGSFYSASVAGRGYKKKRAQPVSQPWVATKTLESLPGRYDQSPYSYEKRLRELPSDRAVGVGRSKNRFSSGRFSHPMATKKVSIGASVMPCRWVATKTSLNSPCRPLPHSHPAFWTATTRNGNDLLRSRLRKHRSDSPRRGYEKCDGLAQSSCLWMAGWLRKHPCLRWNSAFGWLRKHAFRRPYNLWCYKTTCPTALDSLHRVATENRS